MSFLSYAITCVVLILNLLVLWMFSGVMRIRNKMAVNAEDGVQ